LRGHGAADLGGFGFHASAIACYRDIMKLKNG
jgi:hypothetical protein